VVEGEDMTGMTVLGADLDLAQTSHGRYWAMALGSGGMAGNLVSGNTATVTSALPRGKYKAVIGYGDTYKSQGTYNYNLLVDGTQVATVSTSSATNNAVTELTTTEFDVTTDGQAITLTTDNTNTGSRWIDYIYFVQTGSLDPTAPTATLTSNITSNMMVNKTATLTATTGLNGGTLTSTTIYAADANGTKTGNALATSTTETTVTYSFTPTSTGTYYFVSESVNSVGTTTSSLLTVTVVASIDTYTLIIIDKSGNAAITTTVASGSMSEDPLPTAYRSPFAKNYNYYNTAAEAQANSGSNITSVSDFTQESIYVGYDVDATKMGAGKVHAIWANNIWMHVVVNEGNASKRQVAYHDGFITDYQKYDVVNKKGTTVQNSNLTVPNLPIVDNTYMWVLGTDPYNIKLKNKALGFYNSPTSSSSNAMLYDVSEESSAETYYLTYWQNRAGTVDASAAYYRLVKRTDGLTVGSNGDHDGSWRAYSTSNLNDNNWNAVTKLYVQELPKVNINILDEQNEVECIFQGYYNTTATTMPQSPTGSYTPYTLSRAFTSLHKWYYSYTSESVNDPVVYGSAMDFSKLSSNANLYVKYTLDTDKWGSVVKTAETNALNPYTSTGSSYDWYSMKVQNMTQYLLADDSSEYPVTVNETNTAPTETTTLGQWAFTGTPYNVKIINRKYGGNVFLGITESSSNHDYPKLYPSGTEDVNFSFEAVNNIGDNNNRLLLRPMGVFNGDYPYLYLGSSYSPTHAAYEDNAGANSRLVLNWLATTDIIRPSKVHLEVSNATPYVDNAVTLTATVTPDDKDRNVISSLAIEQQVNGVWIEVGTVYTGSNVEGATKDDETGIVTVTYSFTPAAEGTYNFRAHAFVDGEDQYSTAEAAAGGDGDVVEIIATVKPLEPYNSTYTLTLIDKDGDELLTETSVPASRITATNSISGRNGDPLNDDWRSPLVTTYKYYEGTSEGKTSAQAADDANLVDWNTYTGTTIYVGYEVSDAIDLNGNKFSSLNDDANSLMKNRVHRDNNNANPLVRDASKFGKMYLLKFKTSAAYNLEDGSDNRNETVTAAETFIYPYTNGDGPIYMYSHQRYLDQKDNGASTRTRWPWYLVSPKGDPYHVYITSWQNSHTDNTDNTNHYSFLRTYYQSGVGYVTNNVTDDDRTLEGGNGSRIMPTDYMILYGNGTDGLNYKLMTSSVVDDGDNTTTDARQTVISFEQYWRNNPTAQTASGGTKNSTVVETNNSTLIGFGWHNYKTWVNAANWAGTKYTINGKQYSKDYLYDDHWYMSVNVGDGSFDLVEADIDGVLVLLDNHGWEIMRQPIVEHDDPDYATVQAALRKYDSPMVKNYKFYSTRNVDHKVPGYHKYDITYQTSDKTKITGLTLVNSSETITSLANYPEVTSGGALTDLYVTYEVADDYANSYTGAATEEATSASSFLLKQGSNYAKADGTSITSTATVADADSWKLKPNFNIDAEMGYLYGSGSDGEKDKTTLEALYNTNSSNGFDPYNLQIQNATASTYFTTDATSAALSSGAWTGNGSALSLAAVSSHITPTGYDNKTLAVTNATFMAVQDSYGNMRLMPRFQHEQVVENFATLTAPETLTAYDATNTQTTQLATPVTYHIIDNSGNDALQMTVTDGIGLSLPDALKSPMVSAYHYHSTQAHASDASTRATGDLTVAQPDVYVSYTVDATKMTATKKYVISSGVSNTFMHLAFRGQQAGSNIQYRYTMESQDYDQAKENNLVPNQFNHSTLPFVDNTYLWTLGDDPYNIAITSPITDDYKYIKHSLTDNSGAGKAQVANAANASKFCLLYWNGDTNSEYFVLRYINLSDATNKYNTEASQLYLRYDSGNSGDWRSAYSNNVDNAKLVIEELPEVNVNVVNAAGAVEYTLAGRYISTATVPATTTVPFFLQRSYTSGHTYYYNAACTDQMTAGSAPDATKMTNGKTDEKYNIYVRYDLDANWNTENLFKVSTAEAKEYYILKYEANNTTPYLAVDANKMVIGLAASTTDEAQWALYGTPYALRLENRANSGYYLGIPDNAVYNTRPYVYNSFDNKISTWELSSYSNRSNLTDTYRSRPFIRPQGSISRETPLLYVRPDGTNAAIGDKDANNVRVTFEAAAKVTLVIVDKDGREVLSEQVSDATVISTSGDPLSAELRSPYAKNYKYYATADEAQANSGTELDATAIAEKVDATVYVGYDINAADGETILHTDGTAYRIRRNANNSQVMHATFQPSKANDSNNNYGWKMEYQSKDYDDNSSNDVNYNTLPFIDRSWAWEFVNSNGDPYSVKIRNKATGQYLRSENNVNKQYQAMFTDNESEAAIYSLLQFGTGTNYLAIYATDNNVNQTGYLYYNSSDGGVWRLRSTRNDGNNSALAYIRIEELTIPLDIHVVAPANAPNAGEVEATLHGYRNSDVGANTVSSFVPYFLARAYTNDQKFYYTQAAAVAATSGTEISTVDDNSITDSYGSDGVKDIFVSYTLDAANWIPSGTALSDAAKTANTTIIKPFHSSEKKINWYGIRTNETNTNFLKADGTLPAVITRTSISTATDDLDTEDMKRSEWAIIGTPYNLQLVERFHGTASHLGMAEDAVSGTSRAYVYPSGTADVVTTFELVTGLSSTTGKLFLRPQGALNAQAPSLYIGGNDNNMAVSRAAASAQIIDLTWIKETDAKTLTFTLCDRDGSSMSSIVSDYTFTGVAEGDDIVELFNTTGMARRFCEYTYYSDDALTTTVAEVGSADNGTVYVKWDYTADAPVFSTGSETRDYQYYMISVHNGSYDFMMDVTGNSTDGYTLAHISNEIPHTTLKEGYTQFALVGNPYAFKLYSRYAEMNLKTNSTGAGLTFLAEDNGVATTDAVFDLPIPVNASITQSTQMDVRMKEHPEKHIWATADNFWMTNSTGGYAQLMYMVVPVRVFEEGTTALANIMDYQEYALDLNPSGTALATTARITDGDLYPSTQTGNPNYYTHDFRHAFCDYTFYRNYDWSTGVLSNGIPDEGLPYYGGKEQAVSRFFATYAVDVDGFGQVYLLKLSDNGHYICKSTEGTNGYNTGYDNSRETAKNDLTYSYRWHFSGDPYNMQIHCVGQDNDNYALGVKNIYSSGNTPTEGIGDLMLLTSDLKEGDSDDTSYGQYSHWEMIKKSDGTYVLWNTDGVDFHDVDDANRYAYAINTQNSNSNRLTLASGSSERKWVLELPVDFYNITWNIVEGNDHTIVATETVAIEEQTLLTLGDLPESLVRHFCEYSSMYDGSDNSTTATLNALLESYTVTAAKSLYVPYTLSSDAPLVTAEQFSSGIMESDYYEIHFEYGGYTYYNTSTSAIERNDNVTDFRQSDSRDYYQWALVGTPYSVKFYNKKMKNYLTDDGITLSLTASGTSFDLFNDPQGNSNYCAIGDETTSTYLQRQGGNNVITLSSTITNPCLVEFTNEYGLVTLTFVLHYSDKTLRTGKANGTEKIPIETYQKGGKKLIDALPEKWKRAYCDYTFYWNTSMTTESTDYESDANVVTVISAENDEGSMVYTYNHTANADASTIAIHVTYDYQTNCPFKWSTNTETSDGKYWYYWVNHHIQGSSKGKMTYTSGENSFRMTADLLSDDFYTNNYEWCVIGDPYGFRMLCYYDPDQKFNEYVRVSSTPHTYKTSNYLVNRDVDGLLSGQTLFEMRLSHAHWSKYFWMHPIYTTGLMAESDEYGGYSYVCADGLASSHPILATGGQSSKVKSTTIANFTLMSLTAPEMEEYLYYKGFVNGLSNDKVDSDTKTFTIGDETGLTLKNIYNKVKERRASVTDYSTYTHYITDEVADYIHSLLFGPDGQVQMTEGYYRIVPYTYERYDTYGTGETGGRHYIRGYHYGYNTNGYTNSGATSTGWTDRQEYDGSSATRTLMLNETKDAAAYDPASIFHFKATTSDNTDPSGAGHPRYKISTQGMWLSGSDGSPKLYASEVSAYNSRVENIGSVIAQVKLASDNASDHNYLSYVQNFNSNEPVDARRSALRQSFTAFNYSRLYLQPIGTEDDNLLPVKLQLYPGKHTPEGSTTALDYYFATLYVPYDVVLPDGEVYAYAGLRTKNDGKGTEKDWRLQCEKLNAQTIGGTTYAKGKYIPAGTPVLIRATATEGTVSGTVSDYDYDHANTNSYYITLTIPSYAPATATEGLVASVTGTNIFQGKYLEQELSGTEGTDVPASGESVYVFGQATGDDYTTIPDDPDREGTQALEAGFYINKNTTDGSTTYSNRKNLYVRHNKIYLFEKTVEGEYPSSDHYTGSGGGSARPRQFIPLWFGEADIEEQVPMSDRHAAEGVYDLQGRRVATGEQVADGTWRKVVKSGVYIINGKKVYVE